MLKIITNDGARFTGATATDVVSKMMAACLVMPASPESYMKATAKRVRLWNGAEVDLTDEAAFIDSLIEAGLARHLTNEEVN